MCEYDYDKHTIIRTIPVLDGDLKIQFQDVLYYRQKDGVPFVDLKYNTMTNYGHISVSEWNKFTAQNKGFIKKLAWYYEKESRILIQIIGQTASYLDNDKSYAILLPILESVRKQISIDLAPESTSIDSVLQSQANIKQHVLSQARIKLSEYQGEIQMRLCDRCNRKKEEQK